ncbi:TRAP transporter substrate-binding protein [Desertibacillus haloalkaliphilus]|uniref:TRAP transporter substrate-binding protein n=1 Tax=Desertibacillus haloalkaliphilus TaxID=1328930 RepID=UPI001C273E7B|nr:TRAP transporter substrate-binding protein [Desertibacillus haloalkaliphilus]MBU8907763.1 TRAP transporter substrate-binding protein [Desertibacillus haloalkaliphilus]
MKRVVTIFSFLLIGILTAIYIGFGFNGEEDLQAVDYELEGLNEKYTLRFSHVVAENTPKGLAASYFADLVKEKTNGWVDVQIYPNGVLYEAQEEFEALAKNEVQMIAPAFSEIAVHDPNWLLMDLPYVFEDKDMLGKAFNGRIGELLFASIEEHGYMGLDFWYNGFKQLTNNVRPVRDPDDLNGISVRVMPSDVLKETYRTVDASPRVFTFNEVYEALSDERVDGQENTLTNMYSKRFYEQQGYMTVSNHSYLGYAVLMNPQFWDRLPSNYQRHIREAMIETTEWLYEHERVLNEEMYERIVRSGAIDIHIQTEQEKQRWIEAFSPVYDQFVPIIDDEIMNEVNHLHEG